MPTHALRGILVPVNGNIHGVLQLYLSVAVFDTRTAA